MIAMDMFFPSVGLGWEKTNVLVCMDTWSRYCGVYVLDTKRYADAFKAMSDFLTSLRASDTLRGAFWLTRGDLKAPEAIEPYRQPKDGDKPMVLHSATGMPVNIVEGLNAQVQRHFGPAT